MATPSSHALSPKTIARMVGHLLSFLNSPGILDTCQTLLMTLSLE